MSIFSRLISLLFRPNSTVSNVESVLMRINSYFLCLRLNCKRVLFRGSPNLILGMDLIEIGEDTIFGKGIILAANKKYGAQVFSPKIKIGKRCDFGDFLNITACEEISIGDDVLMGRWITISDNAHGMFEKEDLFIPPKKRKIYIKGPVKIGDNVWIGDKATVLSGVEIGEGAVIGANSVVTKNVPPYSMAVGKPATIIKRITN